MKNYVIIGGSVASVGCIEGIRSTDKEGKIIMLCKEKVPAYCRPLISYYLQKKTDFQKMKYRCDKFYQENNVELIYEECKKIDTSNKSVYTEKGIYPYDKLCIATGSSPFVPHFKGIEKIKNKFCFMTQDDALSLEKTIDKNSDVLIIGAGLIGLKCAEGLTGRVKSITVCDLSTRILSSILDEESAKLMQKNLEKNGIKFLLGDSVSEFNNGSATMLSGKHIRFDILVTAVGVKPNIDIASDASIETEKGIIVDNNMLTSVPDIYSAGDCAQGYNMSSDTKSIIAIWPNAYMQGYCAGVNMAGQIKEFDNAIPMNAIGFFGLHALTAGIYKGKVYKEKSENAIKKLFFEDGKLVGYILIGNIENAGIYTSVIREKIPLSSLNSNILKKQPSLAVFNEKNRRKKLGGVV